MSENLNEVVEEVIEDALVMTVPIDDTLTVSGEAADAKAVGDALALKADKSELQAAITVNGQAADAQGKIIVDASQIELSSSDETTVKEKLEAVDGKTATSIPMSSAPGAQSVAAAIEAQAGKTAADIPMTSSPTSQTIGQKITTMDSIEENLANSINALNAKAGDTIKLEAGGDQTVKEAIEERVRTVNGDLPDVNGNVQVTNALFADNLTSSQSQSSVGEFVRRTAGGSASIQEGAAWLSTIRGNRTHVGYVPETLTMTVSPAPRESGEPITATIDRDTFVSVVTESGTINLFYTTVWSDDPDSYGITVTGTPIAGDAITVVYVKENRGTIIQSDPQTMISTGYNLFNPDTGYAIGLKYSDVYGFKIDGTYTAVKYSATPSSTKTTLTPADGLFQIPANGYIWVEGADDDTEVYMTWADWAMGRTVDFESYTESEIDLTEVMEEYFPHGLLRVGDIRDEIDFNTGLAISNVQRLAYSQENVEAAIASGRTWEADTNWIYLERASAEVHEADVDGQYTVSDHGLEYFTDTDIAVYAVVLYGNNLKNKLERDVVTKSQDVVNGFDSDATDKALSAAAGASLYAHLESIENDIVRQYSYTVASGTRTISGLTTGDIVIFTRNMGGMVTINAQGSVIELVQKSGISNISFSNGVLTYVRESQYSGEVTIYTKQMNVTVG